MKTENESREFFVSGMRAAMYTRSTFAVTLLLIWLSGCRSINETNVCFPEIDNVPSLDMSYLTPHTPELCNDCEDDSVEIPSSPDQILDYQNAQYQAISLEDAIRQALTDSKVFRELGGTIVSSPQVADTVLDPSLVYTNGLNGEDAALSAFDAEYSQSVIFEKNDRPFNTSFTGDTNGIFEQDLGEFNFQMTKRAVTGTRFTSRGIINYDDNNQAGNRFAHSWESLLENEFRHPLLQGSGTQFNRIAGNSQVPGNFNGILIARTNSEISLVDFETSVRDFVVNVENAYWDLYYAYRELDAQTDARDAAYEVYKNAEADAAEERVSTLEKASAHEQYLRFETALVESLEGRPTEGTRAGSGSAGGVFRRNVGVRVAERRLRYLLGMSITDGVLLRPADQPNTTPVVFDWQDSVHQAVSSRPETRRQKWIIKQRELELIAAKNYLLPRLDILGRHRFRGLGRDLTGGEPFSDVVNDPGNNNNDNISGAFRDLFSGDFQEWQLGVELRLPVGFRQAHAAVRNAELGRQREQQILKEQKRKILLDLSNAVAEVRRSGAAMSVAEQRYEAAIEYRAQAAERIERGRAQFDVLLEAQRRVLESQIQFINAEVENSIAIRNVHFERGSLLNFHGVALAENQSGQMAYIATSGGQSKCDDTLNYVIQDPIVAQADTVIDGAIDQASTVIETAMDNNQAIPTSNPAPPTPMISMLAPLVIAQTDDPVASPTPASAPTLPVGVEEKLADAQLEKTPAFALSDSVKQGLAAKQPAATPAFKLPEKPTSVVPKPVAQPTKMSFSSPAPPMTSIPALSIATPSMQPIKLSFGKMVQPIVAARIDSFSDSPNDLKPSAKTENFSDAQQTAQATSQSVSFSDSRNAVQPVTNFSDTSLKER
jgi:outer membrane protein TolC